MIPILADILSDAQKEKVSRIILAVFRYAVFKVSKLSKILKASLSRNLIEKPEEAEVKKENCISMVQCKVMKQLELLEQRKFEDEDIQEDISFLMEKMNESVQVIIAVLTFNISIKFVSMTFRTSPATMNM